MYPFNREAPIQGFELLISGNRSMKAASYFLCGNIECLARVLLGKCA